MPAPTIAGYELDTKSPNSLAAYELDTRGPNSLAGYELDTSGPSSLDGYELAPKEVEMTPEGKPIYGEDDILTKAGWRYRKKTTDTDILKSALEAVKGLGAGFAKIPDVVRSKGFAGASGNLPEAMLAAGEGWKDILDAAISKVGSIGMSEEQDLDRQYANYREVAERSVEQVKRSRSRVGDFFRAIGAPEHAATMDESIDQEVANSLSMVLDPTNLIGGGSLKSLLAAGKGAKVAAAGEKVAVAGEKVAMAGEKVSAEVAETTAKVVPPIRDGPAPINWNEPVAKATELAGKGAEKTGRGLQSVADSLVAWEKANPNWATVGSAAIGAASNEENPLTGAFIGAGARTVLPSILKTAPKALVTAGEAAQVAALASREGLDVAAKSGVAGERVSAIAKRLDTPAVNFLLSQSAQLADAAVNGLVIGGGLGYAVNNDPEVSGLGSGIGAGIVGGPMGRLQSIGIDQAGRVAFHKADADGKWVRVSESPASMAKDQDLAVSFLASKSLPERTVLAERLSVAQLAELARGEAAAKGANRLTGEDMDVRFLDTQGMIDAGFDPLVATAMQGVTETAQKPVLFINLDVAADPAKTLWHEMIHGFDRLAPEEKGGKPTQGATDLGNARAELKALYFGTFDAEGNQITKGKYTQEQMLSLEDQYLSRAMNDAEIAAHKAKPMRERAAYIADEMAAEHAGMLGRLSGGDIGKASRYPTTAMGRATLGVLGRAKGALEALGVKFDGGGEVVTSGIFKDPETGKPLSMSNDVREKLSAYLRAKDKITTRLSIDDAHSPVVETVRAADLMKADATPETLARWKDSGIFKLDDKGEILMQGGKLVDGRMMGGKPVLLSKAERERVEANRSAAIFQAIKSAPDDGTPALRSEMVDGVEVFKGKVLGKSQLEAILALPDSIFPASMKERLKKLIEIQADPGSIGIADYYKALTGGKYDTKASMSVMVFVPVSFKISAAGNLRVTTFSVVGFEDKLTQWGKTKKGFFDLWEGNKEAFRNDVLTYLENQGTPEGNVALTKEAIAKKDAINDFIKPFYAGDTDRVTTKSGRDNMIRSPRVDRMASVSRGVGDKMPYDYEKVKRNFMPYAGESATPPQFMRDSLDTAKAMAAAGKTSEEIRAITGWFPGKYDGKMRFEVPDEGATLVESKDWISQGGSTSTERGSRLKDVINHPELFAAYPEVGNVTVDAVYGHVDGKGLPKEGSYTHRDPKIHGDGARPTIKASGATKAQVLSTILHEIQHWIQEKEGFALGSSMGAMQLKYNNLRARLNGIETSENYQKSSPILDRLFNQVIDAEPPPSLDQVKKLESDFLEQHPEHKEARKLASELRLLKDDWGLDSYRRAAGEIESRDVQARKAFTPEQRKAIAPYSSENIATEDAILLSGKGGQARFQPADADYLSAVKSGDTAKAQRMVDQAAKDAGYTVKAYHGTNSRFRIFKPQFGKALWFSEDRAKIAAGEAGAQGTKNIMEVYLRPGRVSGWDEYNKLGEGQITRDFDSTKLDDDWIVYDPANIKSANAVTRSMGEVVPISQRFNEKSRDTRFQPSDVDYRGSHTAPTRDGGSPLNDLSGTYPDDIYSFKAAQYYGHWGDGRDAEAISVIQSMKGKPNASVKIYRAVPTEPVSAAAREAMARLASKRRLVASSPHLLDDPFITKQISELEAQIPAETKLTINPGDWVTTARSYAVDHGESALRGDYKIISKTVKASDVFTNGDSIFEFGYDPITRDEQGNVIPLSQRFNTKSEDIRYQPADGAAVVRLADPEDSTAFANVPDLKKNGKPALDPAGKPKTKKIAYGLLTGMEKHSGVAVDPSHPDYKSLAYDVPVVAQQLINAAIDNGGVDKLAGELVAKTRESLKNPEIAGGMGWYSRMRGHLLRALDEEGREIFSQLLGATSAKTPVEQNFLQAVDAHEGMRSGRYEGLKAKHLEMMDAERAGTLNALIEERGYVNKIGEMERAMSKELRFLKGADRDRVKLDIKSIKRLLNLAPDEREKKHRIAIMKFAEDIVPRRSNGRKFNSNSGAVLKVLIGTWIQNREAPKTPNFAGNLSGRTIAATIDVWAARHLRELIHGNTDGPWRIQPKSEGAVSNADFALGQVIMERAAKQLMMNPDDLQAVLWFAEKDHWDKQGWTSKDGASKSSFDDVFHIFFPEGKDPLTFAEGERKVKELRERLKLSEAEELIDAESDSD